MMSEREAVQRAKNAVKDRRIMEAAWITTILKHTPENMTENATRMVRFAFFRGAQCLLDVLKLAGEKADEETINAMLDSVAKELTVFFKEQKRVRKQVLKDTSGLPH